MPRFVDDVDLASRLERIRELADRLAKAHDDFSEQQARRCTPRALLSRQSLFSWRSRHTIEPAASRINRIRNEANLLAPSANRLPKHHPTSLRV